MSNDVDAQALKLIHILFQQNIVDFKTYERVVRKYAKMSRMQSE